MELDELKQQLKNKLAVDHTGRSDADIAALLTKRTGSVISKLKRSLWIEIICCILVVLVFGYIGITSGYESLKIYFSVFAILSIGMLFLLVYLLKRTTKLGATSSLPWR
jgi:predicted membrane chloride channel (bestrophin family)